MDQTSQIFSALADPTRRQIISMLAQEDLAAGDIAGRIGTMSRPAVVKHMKVLEGAGIIITRASGRRRVSRLDGEALKIVQQWINEYSRFWDDKLTSLKSIIENEQKGMRQ